MQSNEENFLVSIIVPVYNCENYIEECVNSILDQKYKNIEIILLNDGSKDKSLIKCEKLSKKDNRIIVIDKENSGVSNTRNCGIQIAKGKYIMFVDADDFISSDYVFQMVKYINGENLDICKAGYTSFDGNNNTTNSYLTDMEYVEMSIDDVLLGISNSNLFNSSCMALIKKDIIISNRILFNEELAFGEDLLFFWNCVEKSKKIGYINNCGYYYRLNLNSATNSIDLDKKIKYINDTNFVYSIFISLNRYKNSFVTSLYNKYNIALKLIIKGGTKYKNVKKVISQNIDIKAKEYHNFFDVTTATYLNKKNKLELILLHRHMYFLYYIIRRFIDNVKEERKNK